MISAYGTRKGLESEEKFNMNKNFKNGLGKNNILRLVLLALFIAISVVLQVFATRIRIGEFSPALALVPIAISAILLGPIAGGITGGCWGLYILIFDSSCATFFQYSWIGTVAVVLGKGALAGVATGWMNKWLKRYNIYLGMVVAAITTPLVNSLIFRVGEITIFYPLIKSWGLTGLGVMISLFSVSFALEMGISIVLSPVICRICILGDTQLNLGVFTDEEKEHALKKKEEKLDQSKLYQFEDNLKLQDDEALNEDESNNDDNSEIELDDSSDNID